MRQSQLSLWGNEATMMVRPNNPASNQLRVEDEPFHRWYRFVLSYPPHLVRAYFDRFKLNSDAVVLDPFCGTGTTVVEAQKCGMCAIGIEANPFPRFASSVKLNWTFDPDLLLQCGRESAEETRQKLHTEGIDDDQLSCSADAELKKLSAEAEHLLIKDAISPLPLHKTLTLYAQIQSHPNPLYRQYALLALANALVTTIGNLRFGPEVGVGKKKKDIQVVENWYQQLVKVADDLRLRQPHTATSRIILGDARSIDSLLSPASVDAVITSPPYPNEKDYTRTTRLESVLLGFLIDKKQLQSQKRTLVRSNTRGIYKGDDDEQWVENHREIQEIANEIERRRVAMGKTSGFERLYARATRLYFGGIARHLAQLRTVLKPGAQLAYVVGDQASYLQVLIPTGKLLAEIAEKLGYQVEGIDLFRTRFATATRSSLKEEVVVLRWQGKR